MKFKVDYKGLENLQKELDSSQLDTFFRKLAKELAARLLAKLIKRTPVGQYPAGSGRVGGTLRRGWTGGKDANPASYAESFWVMYDGNTYTVTLTNPVEYASYVEYGHRQQPGRYVPAINARLKKSWVEGRFFMTRSELEAEAEFPKIIEKRVEQELRRIFKS